MLVKDRLTDVTPVQPIEVSPVFASYSVTLFCRRVTAISDALTEGFRQANRELDAVWRYGIAQTACLDVSKPCQTAR